MGCCIKGNSNLINNIIIKSFFIRYNDKIARVKKKRNMHR